MIAGGSYNWTAERMEEIDQENSIAGWVIRTKTHYCVPDISSEPLYMEKEKILAMGINSMLALPIQLYDYEAGEKMEVLVGTLQLYFKEKNKVFFPQQIKLITSVVSRFSYVFAQKRKQALQNPCAGHPGKPQGPHIHHQAHTVAGPGAELPCCKNRRDDQREALRAVFHRA